MTPTPEEIRASIHEAELAKGSDPRVAEARSKAAEARARHGYPIEPQEAWPIKLQKESGKVAADAAGSQAPKTATVSADPQAPKTATGLDPAADEVSGAGESPEGLATTVPSGESPSIPATSATPSGAGPAAPVQVDPAFEPEVGELIEPRDVLISHYAGLRVRDSRLPGWLVLLIVLIPLWAILYLAVLGGNDVNRRTTGCVVNPDRALVCFQPETSSP